MESNCNIISCSECDYTSKLCYNITRHMMRKHPQQNISNMQQNISNMQQNISNMQQNIMTENNRSFNCKLCNKIFAKQWILKRHLKICNGISDKLKCIYCNKSLANRHSRSSHMKTCSENS